MATAATLPASEHWDATSPAEVKLQAALSNVFLSSPNSVITKAPDKKTNRFILATDGYHDLQRYVLMGMSYTGSKAAFERKFTRSAFKKVDEIDPEAYNLLRDTTVNVSNHCNDFNTNGLGKLTTAANGAITYAEQCIGRMKEKGETSLYNSFEVLLDKKYSKEPKDEAFEDAKEDAMAQIATLAKVSLNMGREATEMVGLLHAFYNQTLIDKENVEAVEQNFLLGPIDPTTGKRRLKADGKNQEPYGDVMDAEIKRLQDGIKKQQDKRDYERDVWIDSSKKGAAYLATGYFIAWFWIGAGIETDRSFKAMDAYLTAIRKLIKDSLEKATIVRVMELVNAMVLNYQDLQSKMAKALKAMEELESLFRDQHKNFLSIYSQFDGLTTAIDMKKWDRRKAWILDAVNSSVEKFREIKALGEEFNQGAKLSLEEKTA